MINQLSRFIPTAGIVEFQSCIGFVWCRVEHVCRCRYVFIWPRSSSESQTVLWRVETVADQCYTQTDREGVIGSGIGMWAVQRLSCGSTVTHSGRPPASSSIAHLQEAWPTSYLIENNDFIFFWWDSATPYLMCLEKTSSQLMHSPEQQTLIALDDLFQQEVDAFHSSSCQSVASLREVTSVIFKLTSIKMKPAKNW